MRFCLPSRVYTNKMSRFSLPPALPAPLDEAAEARELEAFFRQQDPVDLAAADWHARREQGMNAADAQAFQQWLAASPAHASSYARLDAAVTELRSMPADQAERIRAAHRPTSSQASLPSGRAAHTGDRKGAAGARTASWPSLDWLRPRRAWVAFCSVTLLAAGIGLHQWTQQQGFSNTYVVEPGQRQTVTLPDGSALLFDSDTQAQVSLNAEHREVRITQGQIMFTVAPDSKKPFHVLAGPARVTVVGTRFAVQYHQAGMDAGTVKVAVEEGHVRVADLRGPKDSRSIAAVELTAGQGLSVQAAGGLGPVLALAPGSVALWRKGLVRFENTPLGDALQELERYGPTGLSIRDPAVAALPLGGSFPIGQPQEFARMLTQILPVKLVKGDAGKTEIAKAP